MGVCGRESSFTTTRYPWVSDRIECMKTVRISKHKILFSTLTLLLALILPGKALAQSDGLDSYDPFADYSEFEENSQEEADIHFFRNGRFFNVGFLAGPQFFTSSYGTFIDPNFFTPGLFAVYFFNLRMAAQVEYNFGNHRLEIPANPNNPSAEILGTVGHSTFALHFKLFLNTQNITRGLAKLNPYLMVGLAQVFRTFRFSHTTGVNKDNSTAADIGGGIEIPILKNQMYLGFQGFFRLTNFPGAESIVPDPLGNPTGVSLKGNEINTQVILGINFQ